MFGKKVSEEKKNYCLQWCIPLEVYSLWQTVDELWKGSGLKCRSRASHDQPKCVFVCFYKVWPCYMNLFPRCVSFCYRPLPLPHPLVASWPKQLISWTLAHDTNTSTKSCANPWIHLKVCAFLQKAQGWTGHLHTGHCPGGPMPNVGQSLKMTLNFDAENHPFHSIMCV